MVIFSEKKIDFFLFLAMDPVNIFDPSCRKQVVFDKQISKFAFGDDFKLFQPYLSE